MATTNNRKVMLSEIINLPVHRVANIFPMLPRTAGYSEGGGRKTDTISLPELADSIRTKGLEDPIVLYTPMDSDDTMILDGRNRRVACQLAAKTDKVSENEYVVSVVDFIGTAQEAVLFVFSKNERRDTTASQKADSAAKFEVECPEEFEMMAEMALGNKQAAALKATAARTGENVVANIGHNVDKAHVNEMLAKMFHVSAGYVKDARKIHKKKDAAQEAAERAAAEAERQAQLAKEAEEELERAKTEEDEARIREEALKANEANNKAAEARDLADENSQIANQLGNHLNQVADGNKSLRDLPEEKQDEVNEDPIPGIRTRINTAFTNLKKAVTELAEASGQGEDEYVFVGRKTEEFITHFEFGFGMEKQDD